MRIPKILASGLIATALTAAIGGAAFAQTATPTAKPTVQQRAEEFLSAFAAKLGKTPAEVRTALVGVQKDRIAADVAAGRLTQAQADRMNQRLDQNPAAGLGGILKAPGVKGDRRGGPKPPPFRVLGPAADRGSDLASFLGVQPQELREALASGKSLATYAQEKGKTREALKAHFTAEERARLDAAVTAGRITQAQADQRLTQFNAGLDRLIDRTGQRGPGPRRGGPNGAPSRPQGTGA